VQEVAGSNPAGPTIAMRMNETVLTSIALTGFSVAFLHSAIPTHWLPFVVAGRAQGWNHAKTLGVTALAGTGHVLATALLGLLLTIFGVAVSARIGAWFPRIAGGLLVALGLFFIWRQLSGRAHSHAHLFGTGDHHHHHNSHEQELREAVTHMRTPDISRSPTSDRMTIASLFALLTFSPCEGFLPIYVTGIRFGWSGFALLTFILSIATVAGMLFFTWLTLAGIRNLRLGWLEQQERGVMGSLLLVVGLLVMFFEK
jgi:nickel/cobalt transporter (NicO) family protein